MFQRARGSCFAAFRVGFIIVATMPAVLAAQTLNQACTKWGHQTPVAQLRGLFPDFKVRSHGTRLLWLCPRHGRATW